MIIGFIILTRLNFGHAIKQFAIAAVSCVISLVIPVMIRRMGFSGILPGFMRQSVLWDLVLYVSQEAPAMEQRFPLP